MNDCPLTSHILPTVSPIRFFFLPRRGNNTPKVPPGLEFYLELSTVGAPGYVFAVST